MSDIVKTTKYDPDFTLMARSPTGIALLNEVARDGVEIYKAKDPNNMGGVPTDYSGKRIRLGNGKSLTSLAHEAAHHHHRDSNRVNNTIKDSLMVALIHEAEAKAAEAVVALQLCRSSNLNIKSGARNLPPMIRKSFFSVVNTWADTNKYFFDESLNELDLARTVFDQYLTTENHALDYHLNRYSTRQKVMSDHSSIFVMSGAYTMTMAFFAVTAEPFSLPQIAHSAFAVLGASMVSPLLKDSVERASDYDTQTSFAVLMEGLPIGNLPELEGNYLWDTKGVDWNSSAFRELEQRISKVIDEVHSPFESKLINFVRDMKPTVIQRYNQCTEMTHRVTLG